MEFNGTLFTQYLILGVTNGALIALIALGYTLVYGIVELINFAHGEVFMMGAFLSLTAVSAFGIAAELPLVADRLGLVDRACRGNDLQRRTQLEHRPCGLPASACCAAACATDSGDWYQLHFAGFWYLLERVEYGLTSGPYSNQRAINQHLDGLARS